MSMGCGGRASGPNVGSGEALFGTETFGGNGRTCSSCHNLERGGALSVAEAQELFARDPKGPLFRAIDGDDGVGGSYTRLVNEATILVTLPLPANVILADDPSARSVTLARAIPSVFNTPALDPILMSDGRAPNLRAQDADAIHSHMQPSREPTLDELERLEHYEKTLFTSDALRVFAQGGPPPQLPEGRTDSEKRGRKFFEHTPGGLCAHCHDGPMLNTTNEFNLLRLPPGQRFATASSSELNDGNRPVKTYVFTNSDGSTTTITSPDPGRALITGNAADANFFKITPLWGIKNTAPYFHDNSVDTLEGVVEHYDRFFRDVTREAVFLTPQDQADIVAFLELL